MNRRLPPGWTLGILTGLNLFNYFDRYVLSAVLPSVQRDLAISDGDAGRLATAFMIGYFVTSPVFGYLGDRSSRKWLIAAGIFVWSLGTVLTGFAATFAALVGFRIMVGVGEASYATISPSYISDTYGPAQRNNALTVFYVAIPVGAALGVFVGSLIGAAWGWRRAFIVAGAPGLLLALSLLPFREPERGAADGAARVEKPRVTDMVQLLRRPAYLLVVGGYVAYTFALGAFGHWGPTFLHRVHAMPEKAAGQFFGVVLAIAGLIGTFAGGFAATAWRRRNRAAYAWVSALSVFVAVPVAFGAFLVPSRAGSMTCLGTAMFLLFLSTGPVNTLIIETVPVNLRASAMALSIFMIHAFGDIWSPEIVGRLSDHLGSLRQAALILPAALAVGGALWFTLALRQQRAELADSPGGGSPGATGPA
jgi:MFS transporter, Spinster family, sphingosine-1-phosphate transporter